MSRKDTAPDTAKLVATRTTAMPSVAHADAPSGEPTTSKTRSAPPAEGSDLTSAALPVAIGQSDLRWWKKNPIERNKEVEEIFSAATNPLAFFVEQWKDFKDEKGDQPYNGVKFALNAGTSGQAITSTDNQTDIKLKAIIPGVAPATDKEININLTVVKDSKSDMVTMRCDAKGVPEALQYRLIAAQFLELRKKSMLSEDDAKKVTICDVIDEAGKGNCAIANRFIHQGIPGSSGGPLATLSVKEAMIIKAHIESGYTEITYKGNIYTGIKSDVSVKHAMSPVVTDADKTKAKAGETTPLPPPSADPSTPKP